MANLILKAFFVAVSEICLISIHRKEAFKYRNISSVTQILEFRLQDHGLGSENVGPGNVIAAAYNIILIPNVCIIIIPQMSINALILNI